MSRRPGRGRSWFRLLSLAGLLAVWPAEESTARQPAEGAPVWFADLLDAEPLEVAVRQDLVRHLVEVALDPAGRTAEPPVSLDGDRAPRMIFLSLGDSVSSARVLRAGGTGSGIAVRRLTEQLRRLAETGFEPRSVRIDLVTEVHPRRVDPDRPLPLPRSLYGLAFEPEVGLAYLAGQVVAHTLIDSDQELRLRNVRKRPEVGAAALKQLERLAHEDQVPLFRFATAAWFSDGGEPVPLFRGHRLFAEVTPEALLVHAELGGRYLARSVDRNGRFVYAYLPKTDENKDDYNVLRHCGTIYSMLELYEVTGDRELLAAAERAIGYLEARYLRRCKVGEAETACVVEDGAIKLGGNGLAIIALAKHAAVTGDRRNSRLIDDLGSWIVLTQADDGEFKIHKQSHHSGEVLDFVSGYYPGEALLALVRKPEPDPRWLDAAERGARWLIEVRDRGLAAGQLNHDHWLLYALHELYRLRPDPIYLEHASRIVEAILGRQRRHDPEYPDWLGSYYSPPRSTPTATRSEGLGAAYRMMAHAGRAERAADLLRALELGVRFQLQTQFLPETVLFLRDPARALGGFHRSLTNYEIRIDYVQHNLSALLQLRRILLERERELPPEESLPSASGF